MAIGARWGRAREGGVDRGDGIATDGGQPVSYDDLVRLRERLLEQATDDRIEIFVSVRRVDLAVETPNTDDTGLRLWLENNGCEVIDAKVNGSGHGYATVRPADDREIATDGGTETVTLRLKDPELQQAVADAEEEYGNRSEAIRAALRATYTGEGDAPTTTADGGPTTKAIEAHEWMVDYAGVGSRIGIDTARSLIAQKFQIKAKTIDNLIFTPLKQNDWIAVSQGLHSVAIVVKPRPDANAADDTREVPADD